MTKATIGCSRSKRVNATLRMTQAELLQYSTDKKDTAPAASTRDRSPDTLSAAVLRKPHRSWHLV